MQSLRSKILIWMIRNRHLFKFKMKPEIIDETFDVRKFRDNIDKYSSSSKMPGDISAEEVLVDDVYAQWITPKNPVKNKLLLYIHGGGFISGSCKTHKVHVAKFAKETNLKSIVFDYRLAPEHPFPAALKDCLNVYKWLLKSGYEPKDIIIGGESSGATLTLSLLLAIKADNLLMPKACFLISPVTDLRCNAKSFIYNAKKDIAPLDSWNIWTKMYIGENNPKTDFISPQFGNFNGFPPVLTCVGTNEIHLDDCINFHNKALSQGVDSTLIKWDKMIHAFPILSPLFPEAKKAMSQIGEFIKNHINDN